MLDCAVVVFSGLKTAAFRNNQAMVDEITGAGIHIMMMPKAEEWDGKSVLITGAAGSIGSEMVREYRSCNQACA